MYTSRAKPAGNVGRTRAQSPRTIVERFGYDATMPGAGYHRGAAAERTTGATPLLQKLGIASGSRVAVVGAPRGFSRVKRRGRAPFDVALVFAPSRARIAERFAATARKMTEAGGIWMAWPKKSSGVVTDVTENALRELLLPTGWVDNKVCAIDETYSGLRFVKRKALRT